MGSNSSCRQNLLNFLVDENKKVYYYILLPLLMDIFAKCDDFYTFSYLLGVPFQC